MAANRSFVYDLELQGSSGGIEAGNTSAVIAIQFVTFSADDGVVTDPGGNVFSSIEATLTYDNGNNIQSLITDAIHSFLGDSSVQVFFAAFSYTG